MDTEQLGELVILGVDTHLDTHVAVVIDDRGKYLSEHSFETKIKGYHALLKWAQSFGRVERAGVEGTGTYGAGLATYLAKQSVTVYEINRPNRSMRRFRGKSDPTDAESAARSVLSGAPLAIPKSHSGAAESLRIVSVARRSAVKAKTQAINQLRALLVSAPDDVRVRLWKSNAKQCAQACARVRSLGHTGSLKILAATLRVLAKRWLYFAAELKELNKTLELLTSTSAKRLRKQLGVGPQTAATLLSVAGDNPQRLRSESAFAALCGVNPLPASSGKVVRHRLNRGGNRTANNAIWTVAMVRMRSDPKTQVYVDRRTAEGKSSKEICRCLKRYIARELYPLILADLEESRLTI